MPRGADIISFSDHAKQTLAAAREGKADAARLIHLERVSGHQATSVPAAGEAAAKAVDIQFPLRSIPKWVPAGD